MPRAAVATENWALAGAFAASQPSVSTTSYWEALHTGDPGTTGASEYAGVTRLQYPVATPSSGSTSNTSSLTFTTSGSLAVTHTATWDALTAGNFRIGSPMTSPVTAVTIIFAVGALSYGAS